MFNYVKGLFKRLLAFAPTILVVHTYSGMPINANYIVCRTNLSRDDLQKTIHIDTEFMSIDQALDSLVKRGYIAKLESEDEEMNELGARIMFLYDTLGHEFPKLPGLSKGESVSNDLKKIITELRENKKAYLKTKLGTTCIYILFFNGILKPISN